MRNKYPNPQVAGKATKSHKGGEAERHRGQPEGKNTASEGLRDGEVLLTEGTSLTAQLVRNPPAMQESWVLSLG